MEPINKTTVTLSKPVYLDNITEKADIKKNIALNEFGLPIYPPENNNQGSNKQKLIKPEQEITADNKEKLLEKMYLITQNTEQSFKEDKIKFTDKSVQIGDDKIEFNNAGEAIYVNSQKEKFNILNILDNMTPRQQIIMELCLRVYNDMNISTSKLVTSMSGLYQELIKEQAHKTRVAAAISLVTSIAACSITVGIQVLSAVSTMKKSATTPAPQKISEQKINEPKEDIKNQEVDIKENTSETKENGIEMGEMDEMGEMGEMDEMGEQCKKVEEEPQNKKEEEKQSHDDYKATKQNNWFAVSKIMEGISTHSHVINQAIIALGKTGEEYIRSEKDIKKVNKNNAHTSEQTLESQISSSVQAKTSMLEMMNSIVNTILNTDQALVDNMRKS
uniref:Type III effector protein n=1 Tax=Escherichia coli TaxID=562 RepID=A0A765T5Q8_ECOLX